MIGAILGDIIGSRFEFRPTLNENFELFTSKNTFTDDTILMIAVADALMNNKDMVETLKEWYLKYPKKPFGPNFSKWAEGKKVSKKSMATGEMRLAHHFYIINEPDMRARKYIIKIIQALIALDYRGLLRYANVKGSK